MMSFGNRITGKTSLLGLSVFGLVAGSTATAYAQTTPSGQAAPAAIQAEQALKTPAVSPEASKAPTKGADSAFAFRSNFLVEMASNPIGGLKHGTTTTQYLTLGTDVDLEKLLGWNGAVLHATVMGLNGTPLNIKYTGAGISHQEANAPFSIFRFTNLTLEQKFSLRNKNDLNLVFGRLGAFPLFAQSSYACNFQSHFFCGSMYGFSQMTGTALTPVSTWGGRVRYNFTPKIYAQLGAFKIDSSFNLADTHIFDFGRSGITGTNTLFEAGYESNFTNDSMPRRIRLGLWRNSAPRNDVLLNTQGMPHYLAGGTKLTHTGETGGYILADKVVQRDSPTSPRHLALITSAVYTTADSEPLKYAFRLGAVKTGTFAGRDNDTFGVAAGVLGLSNKAVEYMTGMRRRAGGTEEVEKNQFIFEVSYGYRIAPGATLRPNFQYYVNPDPRQAVRSPRAIPNIGVIGLQLNVSLDTLLRAARK